MFRYLGAGPRDYLRRPIALNRRLAWEFEAVLSGRIAPLVRGAAPRPAARRLWVFPPGLAHGWTGDGGEAEVAVFHLAEAPAMLARAAGDGWLEVALDDADAAALRAWAAQAIADRARPTSHAPLRDRRIAAELCLLAARAVPEAAAVASPERDARIAEQAAAWLEEHLQDGAGIDGAARALGLSPAHLRRLVGRALGESPRDLLARLRLARADAVLADPAATLADAARACGLGSPEALCRAYRRWTGRTPRAAR